MQFLPFFTP